jgi:hypothetical protein
VYESARRRELFLGCSRAGAVWQSTWTVVVDDS